MAKLFIGIALLVMLATAGLAFLAKGNIDKLKSTLLEAKSNVTAEQAKAKAAQNEATKAKEDLTAANAKLDESAKALEAKVVEATGLSTQVAEQKTLVEAKTKEVADLTEKLGKMGTPQPGVPNIEDPRIGELQGQLAKAHAELAEAKQVSESMSGRVKDMESKVSAAESKIRLREIGSVRAGLQGRILAVNQGWNFVVLSVGDKQGVLVNAPLLVLRGGEPIARLRITSVETSTSIADVLPGSVRRGTSVQPGDTVVFEGRSSVTQPAKPAAEAGADAGTAPVVR
jgi:uncharacterized coiled-coil protein SlyX